MKSKTLSQIMTEKNLTNEEAAKRMNTSASQIRNYKCADVRLLELRNGDFIVETKHTKILKIN